MDETYCGNVCEVCDSREELNCPGCKDGPGRRYAVECELAKCARDKGHATCATCAYRGSCGKLTFRTNMAKNRIRKIEAENEKKALIAQRVPILAKWLWIYFWLLIPNAIGSYMMDEKLVKWIPGLWTPGLILTTLCTLGAVYILLKIGAVNSRYLTAAVCGLVSSGISLLMDLYFGSELPGWSLFLSIPAMCVGLVGEYNEFTAHSEVLYGVDNELAVKWVVLWKWNIGLLLGMFGSTLLAAIIPAIGSLILLAAAVGIVVVSVLRWGYLYRTAKAFREYPVGV